MLHIHYMVIRQAKGLCIMLLQVLYNPHQPLIQGDYLSSVASKSRQPSLERLVQVAFNIFDMPTSFFQGLHVYKT